MVLVNVIANTISDNVLSYTVRSAGLVLLQTVPEGLGACDLRSAALRVAGVLAIHELHVWQMHRDRVVATAHIVYQSHEVQ